MFRLIILSVFIALAAPQVQYNRDPKTTAILSEQRYLSSDGRFGAAYTQEDGTDFKEETDVDGTRHGSYSYIDPTGQKRTITYTAGKNGFQASGADVPVAPQTPVQPVLQTQYKQLPKSYQPQFNNQPSYDDASGFDDGQYDPRYNNPSFSGNNVNTPINRGLSSAVSPPLPQQPQYNYNTAQQSQPQYNPVPQQHFNHYETTPNPHRFQPPGKLSLNRTPDGFSYSFNKIK